MSVEQVEFGFLIEVYDDRWEIASNDGGGMTAYTLDEVGEFMRAKTADWIGDLT